MKNALTVWMLSLIALACLPVHAQVVGPGFVNYVTSAPSGTCSQGQNAQVVMGSGAVYTCQSGTWATVGGGTGTVTSVATTSPITGGTFTTTGTIACATCVTSAASLTSNAVVIGGGSQASSTISASTTTTQALFATAGAPAFRAIATGDLPSTIQGTLYTTATRCAAAGTAASPSVAACSAAPSGSFSCATNASTATCTVNTTAVTANSAIFVQPDSSLGSLLSVTCNTTADTGLVAPRVSARAAATSFTLTLGTFATNPLCFNYWVVN